MIRSAPLLLTYMYGLNTFEPQHDKTNKMTCTQRRFRSAWASAQSDQSSLSPTWSVGSLATHWAYSKDWSDWADAETDLNLPWAHSHIVGFVMLCLILSFLIFQELDSIACRSKEFEVKLVYLRLLSVLLSRTKAGTKPSSEVINSVVIKAFLLVGCFTEFMFVVSTWVNNSLILLDM